MSLMEMFSNPATFGQLSLADKLAGAGITTLMGMGITFIVLSLLWLCISIMSKAFGTAQKKEKPADAPAAAAVVSGGAGEQAAACQVQDADDTQLIAVITAAIAAYEGETAMSNLVVRKISRISGDMPAWAHAGHSDCIASRQR